MEPKELILKVKSSNENEYLGKNKSVNHIKPLVSVLVITYQHANYIKDCIEGILMQKTDFPFEIIIGEDESNDGTREICMLYAEKYPDKIRLFLRSRKDVIYINGNPTGKFNAKATEAAARGKYIATCEGDDYWIDPYKLEKQVKYMENNPECSLCCHASRIIDVFNPKAELYIRPSNVNKEFTVEEIIKGHGGFISSNSMLYPTKLAKKMPNFTEKASFGDYPLAIFLSTKGKVYYIDEIMSVYRMNVRNSWCSRMTSSIDGLDAYEKELIEVLENINIYTKYKYNVLIKKVLLENKNNFIYVRRNLLSQDKCEEFVNEELELAIRNAYLAIKKTWVLLTSSSGVNQNSHLQIDQSGDYWHLTNETLQKLFGNVLGYKNITLETHGNDFAVSALIPGKVSNETKKGVIDLEDPYYQVVITVSSVKESGTIINPLKEIVRISTKLTDCEEELAEIKCSKSWQIALFIRRTRLLLAPKDSIITAIAKKLIILLSKQKNKSDDCAL